MLLHEKKLYASPLDRVVHDLFVKEGVIVEYHSHKVAGQQTCSLCSDGFRPHMKEEVLKACHARGGATAFFHSFGGNGEAMRFAYNSPLSEGFSERNNDDVWGILKTKELCEVLCWAEGLDMSVTQHRLVHHWPCKAALSRGINLAESIDLVVRGKLRIKQQIPHLKVALDFFCDWGPDEHSIALIKKEAYVSFISTNPLFAKQYDSWLAYEKEVMKLPTIQFMEKEKPRMASAM